jgi:hypothetical protein
MDFRTQELALERQTRLWELSNFELIRTQQEEITEKNCRFQIREEGSRLNTATQNAIGFALLLLLDPSPGDAVTKINLKKVFATCPEKFSSTNGAPDSMKACARKALCWPRLRPKDHKVPFGNHNGRPNRSYGLD